MPPREIVVGVIAVSVQLLYSTVYPYAEQSLQSLPKLALEAQNLLYGIHIFGERSTPPQGVYSPADDIRPATAAEKTPRQKKKKGKRKPRSEVLSDAVARRLLPHMSAITQALKTGNGVDVPPSTHMDVSWDVHRITDAEWPWAYFFRLGVRNVSPRPCPLQGVARFYVLRSPDGLVFPIHRITEGPASFTLNPGEEYKYSWIFYTKYKTVEASGGMLVENRAEETGILEKQFLNATLPSLEPAKGEGISSEQVQSLMGNYLFMGALDLRGVAYE